jgi:hypothetical protein
MNRSENRMPENRIAETMRRLSAMAPGGASSALGDRLKDEFRQHHARRRRNRIAQLSSLAACLAASVVFSFVLSRPRASTTSASHKVPRAAQPSQSISAGAPAGVPPGFIEPSVSLPPEVAKARVPIRTRKNPSAEAARFVTLPTFDPAIPIDRLEMVRVDLPGRALRLVGFPISEDIAERRVVADVLLAQDGTPYALRLVQSSEAKEQ